MKEILRLITDIGYDGDESLSAIIDWIRVNHKFNIWIEHGLLNKKGKTHDVTTDLGCHRGNYANYELAQAVGIMKFISQYEKSKVYEKN